MEKSHTPEQPYRGKLDKVFDAFTKKSTPAGQESKLDAKSRKKSIDDVIEKAGG